MLDASFAPLAADSGAKAILNFAHHGAWRTSNAIRLPRELEDLSKTYGIDTLPATVQFRVGSVVYLGRIFLAYPQSEDPGSPMVTIYFKQDAYVGNSIARVAALYHLTDREQEALQGIAAGLTSKEIAAGMNISPNTVKSFLRIIMLKMGVATRVGLVGKLLEDKDNHGSSSDFLASKTPPSSSDVS